MNAEAKKRYKDIDLPFICPESKRSFDSVKGLAIYLSKTLRYNHQEYYDKYINHRESDCYFCGKKGKFITVGKGYRNLCDDEECVKKSFKSNSVHCIRYRKMCSIEDAEIIFKNLNIDTLEKRTIAFDKIKETNPDFHKENSGNCKEYYLKRGYSKDEAIMKAREAMDNIHKKTSIKKKKNYEFYKDSYNTNKEFYLKRGFTEDESIKMQIERQTTFSKEKCITNHGEEAGLDIWRARQDKWMHTLDQKSDEEKIEINRKKLFNHGGFSKISQELFWRIFEKFSKNNIKFEELNGEAIRYDKINKKHYKYDYIDFSNKRVIEFNGDFWHCNPIKYNEDHDHKIMKITAKEIWYKDKLKNDWISNRGFEVLIIWESDYRNNPQQTLDKCIEFINKK